MKKKKDNISFRKNVILQKGYLINLDNGVLFTCNKKAQEIISFIIDYNSADKDTIGKKFGHDSYYLLSELEKAGMLESSKRITKKELKLTNNNGLFSNSSFYLQWHITKKCNLRCKHCYFDEYKEENTLKFLKKDFAKIEKLSRSLGKSLIIAITGGEPLLHPQLRQLINYLNNRKIVKEIRIASNGILLTDELANFLKKNNVNKYQISLDGTKETHEEIRGSGSFEKALEAIKKAHNNDLETSVQMVVNKKNLGEIDNLFILLRDLKVKRVRFSLFVPIGTGNKIKKLALSKNDTKKLFYKLNSLSQKYKKPKILAHRPLWCLINDRKSGVCDFDSGVCLMPNGDLYPCSRLPISIGNVRKNNIFDIWYNSDFMWLHRNHKNLKGKCQDCRYRQKCGGCRAMAYAINKDSLSEDPTCWFKPH